MYGAALITGATGGLGAALALEFAGHGFDVVLAGRNPVRLHNTAAALQPSGVKIYSCTVDLAEHDAARSLYSALKDNGIKISVLVNNAGVGAVGEGWAIDDDDLMQINLISAMQLTKLYCADMCAAGLGSVLNVCSVGAFQPGPYTASYYASKSFLYSYTLALRSEAEPYGVNLSALCPGSVETEFFRKMGADTPKGAVPAEKVAAYAYKMLMRERKTIIYPFKNRLALLLPQAMRSDYIAHIKKLPK